MIQLAFKELTFEHQQVLVELQQFINNEKSFAEKVSKAQSLWGLKGSKSRQSAFIAIHELLETMCVYVGVCNYCEQNEGSDIEHIYPKSFFPEKTFVWENYLLACKQCNTGYKLDKCDVLDNQDNLQQVVRGNEPVYKAIAFINPRLEDPNHFMMLNFATFTFELMPDLNKADLNKAKSTLEILKLNERHTLLEARKSAARHYYDVLERLSRLLRAESIEKLQELLSPNDNRFDLTQPLDSLKLELKESYKKYITKHQHPSVWYAIKIVESKMTPQWKKLFEQIPEALTW